MGPTRTFLNLKSLSPQLQKQVKKAVDRLLRNRLTKNLKDFSLLTQKQFSSQNKPFIKFRLDLVDKFHRRLTIKESSRNPFVALSKALSKTKSFLRKTDQKAVRIKKKK